MRGAVEMRFKVGDKVRVLENLTLEDVGRVHDMLEFRGLEATVETVFDQAYHLTVDNHEWYWMDELLEPVEEELEMSIVRFDIPEWVNWLARDESGGLYGYLKKPIKCLDMWGIEDCVLYTENARFITEDPNHYPQVKWEDEEPKAYKDGVALTYEPSELDTNEAVVALQNYGRFVDPVSTDVIHRKPEDAPTVSVEEQAIAAFANLGRAMSDSTSIEPDMIQNPPHYKQYSFEPIDIITEVVKEYPPEIGFHIGTTLKYLFRSPFKGKQEEDINKASYYLARAIRELTDE